MVSQLLVNWKIKWLVSQLLVNRKEKKKKEKIGQSIIRAEHFFEIHSLQ